MTIGDELRERAQTLRDNKFWWINGEPDRPQRMCAVFTYQNGRARAVLSQEAQDALSGWLPKYLKERYPGFWAEVEKSYQENCFNGHPKSYSVTDFNDSVADDVDDVITMLEKAAADIG
jgi:hypothetical protein